MKSVYLTKNKILFSQDFKNMIQTDPVILVDAGARGGLENPWGKMDEKILRVVGFDPDKKECEKLNNSYDNFTFFPLALWSSTKKIKINLTENPSCSSVYKPNFNLIKKYKKKHWESRIIKDTVQFQATALDSILLREKLSCDFLKIDTQGAEYEILKGANKLLQKDVFGVLLETWTTEVYKDQFLSNDILELMHDKGFSLFDVNIAAAWQRETKSHENLNGKSQIIGLDLLFFKEPVSARNTFTSFSKLIKAIAISEVFGFPDYAIEIIDDNINNFSENKEDLLRIKSTVIKNAQPKNKFILLITKLLYLVMGIKFEEYPSLHD